MPDLRLRETVGHVATLCLVPFRAASLFLPNLAVILMANPKLEQYREENSGDTVLASLRMMTQYKIHHNCSNCSQRD